MENVIIVKFIGHNGVQLEEEFQTFSPEVDYKKEINTLVLKNGYLSPAFLEEVRYNAENPSEDLPYEFVTVDLPLPYGVVLKFSKAKFESMNYINKNGKFEIKFTYEFFDFVK